MPSDKKPDQNHPEPSSSNTQKKDPVKFTIHSETPTPPSTTATPSSHAPSHLQLTGSGPDSPTQASSGKQQLGTGGSNSPEAIRTPPKHKGPQKVRFPLDNNPQTKRVYLPSDESSIEARSDTISSPPPVLVRTSSSPGNLSYFAIPTRRSFGSPLTTPPINIEYSDGSRGAHIPSDDESENFEEDREGPMRRSASQYDSRPPLSRNQSSQALLTIHDTGYDEDLADDALETGELGSRSMLTQNQMLGGQDVHTGMLDIGLITSGGLAPGASGAGDHDSRAAPNQRDLFKSRGRVHDPEALATTLNTHYNSGSHRRGGGGHSGNDDHEGGIPLLELHRKLDEIAQSEAEEEDKDHVNDESRQFARNLVREHSRYISSRAPSLGTDQAGMTIPSSSFFEPGNSSNANDPLIDLDGTVPNDKYDCEGRHDNNANTEGNNGETSNSGENATDPPDGEEVYQDGTITPRHEDYVPAPPRVRQGVLGSLLKLYGHNQRSEGDNSTGASTAPSGASTPLHRKSFVDETLSGAAKSLSDLALGKSKSKPKWHKSKSANASTSSLAELVISSNHLLKVPGDNSPGGASTPTTTDGAHKKPTRPKNPRRTSALEVLRAKKEKKKRAAEQREALITQQIADLLQRQRFILRLCRALMLFGAPTHRLEEYMKMTSRVLGIDGQFLYIPGCMIISFGDSSTHTSEMQLVRCVQGVNLSKLHETHTIYKEVIHGILQVEEASVRIEDLLSRKNLYSPWLCVFFFGFASLAVGPFAFGGRWRDMPISFLLGGSVGILQTVVAPRSALYNNVFEVTASIAVSFLGRAFGSIGSQQDIFCFAAITQSSLALILPGYIILCGSLELQSRNIVAGSVRMFYAIIYSLFLGFGITLGATIYGWLDSGATSETTCPQSLNPLWRILFVPLFTLGLALVNQAHWRQIPVMLLISSAGYTVTYFCNRRLTNAAELTSAIGAFVIGVLGNMYSRLGHGLAFAAMLPAIFVQVPSGVASQGSLIAGIDTANNIVSNSSSASASSSSYGNVASLGITMVQVSIGITVGLFVATLVIYPFGKKRSGLFTF